MIIYNVTVNIDNSVNDEWLEWMKKIHIPDVMKTGLFAENKICRVLGDEESGGKTYAIQYFCKTMNDFKKYEKEFAQSLRAKHSEKYKDKFTAFRTLLEIVS